MAHRLQLKCQDVRNYISAYIYELLYRLSMAKKIKAPREMVYEKQAEICAALASAVRLQILELVSDGEKSSSDLLRTLKIPKTNLSQHLAVLKEVGILHTRKAGQFQYVSLALPKIKDACAIVKSVLREKLDREELRHAEIRKELRSKERQ